LRLSTIGSAAAPTGADRLVSCPTIGSAGGVLPWTLGPRPRPPLQPLQGTFEVIACDDKSPRCFDLDRVRARTEITGYHVTKAGSWRPTTSTKTSALGCASAARKRSELHGPANTIPDIGSCLIVASLLCSWREPPLNARAGDMPRLSATSQLSESAVERPDALFAYSCPGRPAGANRLRVGGDYVAIVTGPSRDPPYEKRNAAVDQPAISNEAGTFP
jgi:hypothetical protein